MYGIADQEWILVDYGYRPGGLSLINTAVATARYPVAIKSKIQAEVFLLEIAGSFSPYNLEIFEFTQEQEAELIVERLQGS